MVTACSKPVLPFVLADSRMNLVRNLLPPHDFIQASVHAPETELRNDAYNAGQSILDAHGLSTGFRHSGWRHDRSLICQALVRTERPAARIRDFKDCGSHAYVLRNMDDPQVHRVAGSACHDRFCLPCGNERSHAIALNVIEQIAGKQVRFLTLTLLATAEPLEFLLDKLYSSFQALRRRAFWKKRVTGGVAFLEVKWIEKTQHWHPHFHILIEGRFLPYQQIRKLWHEITGDSFIIDIKLVREANHAAEYVTKYAGKPFNNTFVNRADRLDEAMIALHGRKLAVTFGSWRGVILARVISDGAWESIGALDTIITRAANGDTEAIAIMRSLTNADLSELYARAPPDPPVMPPAPPPDTQLDWLGVWQQDGTWTMRYQP